MSRFAQPEETEATTGTMVYGTVMDEGVDTTSLTSTGTSTADFHNTVSGMAIQGIAAGNQPAIVGANGGIVKLRGRRQADLWSGGSGGASTQFIIDITGYYA